MAKLIQPKPFNIVVWGATGFTGRLVCEHIAKDYPGQFTWAIAGRDRAKLQSVHSDLVKINKKCQDVPIIVADAADVQSLKDMTSKARVVLATVGPFSKHNGKNVVDACVANSTHYCDITAEPSFIRRMQLAYGDEAQSKKVKVVHCCGFDSIPADLGTFLLVDYCRTKLNKHLTEVHSAYGQSKGGLSGGTSESAFYIASSESMGEMVEAARDPYFLVRDRTKVGNNKHAGIWPSWDPILKSWTAPFLMEFINAKVVHWSAALSFAAYGPKFRYVERMLTASWLGAMAISVSTILAAILIGNPLTRPLIRRLLPPPGQGPSREMMMTGNWTYQFAAVTEEPAGQKPNIVKLTVQDPHRDPGYWGTARMLLECGLALTLQEDQLEAQGRPSGGVLTPSAAMGMVLVERLKAAGIKFDISHS